MTGRRPLLVLGLIVLLGTSWYAWRSFGWSDQPWAAADIQGKRVVVSYQGSECRDDATLEIEESADRIVLTVREVVRARSCSDVGVMYEVSGDLERQVGDRVIIDGACLQDPWKSRPPCQGKPQVTVAH